MSGTINQLLDQMRLVDSNNVAHQKMTKSLKKPDHEQVHEHDDSHIHEHAPDHEHDHTDDSETEEIDLPPMEVEVVPDPMNPKRAWDPETEEWVKYKTVGGKHLRVD